MHSQNSNSCLAQHLFSIQEGGDFEKVCIREKGRKKGETKIERESGGKEIDDR